ncbi:MAG: right-handed parallel beta-helix repeat-containing protein [Ignavibacteriae bacterium]|nr:right-handed parallel beta-helix repeat-containing protein [Ignavibacteriota bacterium]
MLRHVCERLTPVVVFLAMCAHPLDATERRVSTADELRSALTGAQPGDIILCADGQFDFNGDLIVNRSGTDAQPIIIKSMKRGKTSIVGNSRIVLDAVSHLVIEGFEFVSTKGTAIELRACSNVRITRNIFHLKETTKGSWVMITGKEKSEALSHHNRVDHNLFEKKSMLGNFITIEGTKTPSYQVSQYDTIDHNHFRDIGPRAENVLEAIRIGSSDFSLSSGFTLLEMNLFERCDGDPEYISIKSSDNIIRNNTFRECLGSLSLRHGNRNTIEGNFILGNGRTGMFTDSTGKTWTLGTGGVRFCGDSMIIINNYCEGLTGTKWDATLAITGGDAEYGDGQKLTKHHRSRYATIAFNTFVNNRSGIEVGYDGEGFQGNWWRMPPVGITIANNVIVGSKDTLIKFFSTPLDSRWESNIAFARGSGIVSGETISGVRVVDPKLIKQQGFWRITERSPCVDAAVGGFAYITQDVDGQTRDKKPDVGADEFSSLPKRNHPLTMSDVGPKAK